MNSEVRFASFLDRLIYVIGDQNYTPWAERHGLSPVTVLGWFNGAALYPKSWDKLVAATGISKEWWLNGQSEPEILPNHKYAIHADLESTLDADIQSSKKVKHPEIGYGDSIDAIYIDHYVNVRGGAGPGQIIEDEIHDEAIVKVRMDGQILRERVGSNFNALKLASVKGDSMEPTMSHGDQVLVDTSCDRFVDDAIYAIQQGEYLRFKRIKLKLDGSIIVKSDNPIDNDPETYSAEEAEHFKVVGRVIPYKFGKFKI